MHLSERIFEGDVMRGSFGDIRQSEHDLTRAHALAQASGAREPHEVLSSSEHTLRQYKASESAQSAFAAEGFGSPPAGLARLVADYVNARTLSIPIGTLANMAPGSGNLASAASAGVTMALGSLSADQREVLKAGGDPTNSADMLRIGAKLGLPGYAHAANAEGGVGGNNGGRFAGIKDGAATAGKSGSLESSYSALLKEGVTSRELNAVLPQARELGWTDKEGLGALARTGHAGVEVAREFEAARKRGDRAGMESARKKAEENAKDAKTEKEKKGWRGMMKKFDKLNKPSASNRLHTDAESASPAPGVSGSPEAEIIAALRKKRAAAQPK